MEMEVLNKMNDLLERFVELKEETKNLNKDIKSSIPLSRKEIKQIIFALKVVEAFDDLLDEDLGLK